MGQREEMLWLRYHHEDWRRIVHSDEFLAWLETQPETVRLLADSERARDVIALIDAFKIDTHPTITGFYLEPGVLH